MASDGFDRGVPRSRPRDPDNKFEGGFLSLLFEYDCQLAAVSQHSAAEGKNVPAGAVLESYDRALHPWIHGRRFADLVERFRKVVAR